MKKLSAFIVSSIVAVSAVQANANQGFYAGITAGYRNLLNKTTATVYNNGAAAGKHDLNLSTFNGGISLSYLHGVTDSVILGVELAGSVNPGTNKAVFHDDPANNDQWLLKVRSLFDYSASVVAGLSFDKTLPYVKIGVSGSDIRVKINRTGNIVGNRDFKFTKRPFGVLVGLGVQFPVTESVYFGTEYNYTHFVKTVKFDDETVRRFKFTPKAHTFKIKLAYKF